MRAPVDEATGQHADRLVDPHLPQLCPFVAGTRFEEDLGETEHGTTIPGRRRAAGTVPD
jgi:hypothetical protein